VLADALAEEEVDVEIAGGGIEALQILSQRFFAYDAVVLDLQMPDLDGRSLMDRLRRLGGALDLKIIVVAAGAQEELERLKGREGANEVIRKGTPLEEILRRLLAALSA
jgi:CheY-like chemotaxis protein